ncbi:MAG: sodium/solute symporter [Candidatus Latescibacteria bacterium]|nr:sodium/solute symporter [Candidatus Latescibacterota bacterium]
MISPTDGLTVLDWMIVALYAAGTIGLGYYYSRRQASASEYFTGGGRMSPSLIGISLFATLLSTISYLSVPGEAIGKGPVWMLNMLAFPLVYLVVGYVLIPVYMRQRVTSAYELLEARLGLGIRLLGALMFIALRLVWMSLLIYLASSAMAVMLSGDETWIPVISVCTGVVAVIYTSLGGIRAVVITDTFQTVLMLGGAWLVIGIVTYSLGGFGWAPAEWQPQWDVQPFFSFDPAVRLSVLGSILSSAVWAICTAGGDQTAVQRFMATRDAAAARRSYATQLVVNVVVVTTLWITGFALMGYYQAYPDLLPVGIDLDVEADRVFPHFIAYYLPPGVSGLVVAAMFAAAMSSIDSGVNSITAVISTDFVDRLGRPTESDRGHTRMAQIIAWSVGAVVVGFSSLIGEVPGNITAVTNKTTNLLTTPIFALFFFALFVPFARPAGVVAGAVCGISVAGLIAFSGPLFGVDALTGEDPVSFMWISPIALCVNMAVGTTVSWILCMKYPEKE